MHKGTGSAVVGVVAALVGAICVIGGSVDRAMAQARGVIIQIPDDVAPGSSRPAPPPAPAPPNVAPSPNTGSAAGPAPPVCQGASCGPNVLHVLNTSNRTCLVLSKDDLKGGKDVRKLSTLLPAPLFVVASGGCP